MELDRPGCVVDWCSKPMKITKSGTLNIMGFCTTHEGRYYRYGTPTPDVACFECHTTFPFSFPGSHIVKQGNGPQKFYCPTCNVLLSKYNHLVPNHHSLLYFYKLTPVGYIKLLIRQRFSCALCHTSDVKLVVDHDHSCCPGRESCGKCVRGLVCYNCNIFLGRYDTNPDILQQTHEYLDYYDVQRRLS